MTVPVSGRFWVVPASRVAMDTSSLPIAFAPPPPLTFKATAPKLIVSDEFNCCCLHFTLRPEPSFVFFEEEKRRLSLNLVKPLRPQQPKILD